MGKHDIPEKRLQRVQNRPFLKYGHSRDLGSKKGVDNSISSSKGEGKLENRIKGGCAIWLAMAPTLAFLFFLYFYFYYNFFFPEKNIHPPKNKKKNKIIVYKTIKSLSYLLFCLSLSPQSKAQPTFTAHVDVNVVQCGQWCSWCWILYF